MHSAHIQSTTAPKKQPSRWEYAYVIYMYYALMHTCTVHIYSTSLHPRNNLPDTHTYTYTIFRLPFKPVKTRRTRQGAVVHHIYTYTRTYIHAISRPPFKPVKTRRTRQAAVRVVWCLCGGEEFPCIHSCANTYMHTYVHTNVRPPFKPVKTGRTSQEAVVYHRHTHTHTHIFRPPFKPVKTRRTRQGAVGLVWSLCGGEEFPCHDSDLTLLRSEF